MDASESTRSRNKKEFDEKTVEEDRDLDDGDRRKHRSTKSSRKHQEDAEEPRRSSGERKSSRAGSGDEEDYDIRRERESRSKLPRKGIEERDRDVESSRKSTQVKTRSRVESSSSHDVEIEKGQDKDYGRRDQDRNAPPRKKWDESDGGRRADSEKGGRSGNRDDKRVDVEDSRDDNKQRKMRERSEDRYSAKGYGDKVEKHRRDEEQSRERSVNVDEDGHGRMRDRNGRDVRRSTKRSRSPERRRYHRESDEHDRGFSESEKEREKESYRDDRSSKGKDSWEGGKEQWRRSHSRQDAKDGENSEFDRGKEWESQRREQERSDGDKQQLHGRPGYRKDARIRSEGVKASLNSGIDNSDSIEIKPNKNLDFGREESVSTFPGRRNEGSSQQEFASGAGSDEEWGYPPEDRYQDDSSPMDQSSGRNDSQAGRGRGQKGAMNLNRTGSGQSSNSGMHPPFGNNQGSSPFNRPLQQGQKGGRSGRGGRGRLAGRDAQRVGLPLPMMGPPFGHLGLPPGPMQPIGPNASPGPPMGPGVYMPPFPGPLVWPGARGVDMNMLAVPPSLPPIPPPASAGPQRFGPNMGTGPNHPMFFNQPGSGRGVPPNLSGPGFSPMGQMCRDMPHDKPPGGWTPMRNNGPSGKAPSRGEQNDYSQNFVDTGKRPQNFIRELEAMSVVEDYPKLRELIQRKDEIVAKAASPPMYYKCDLKEHVLSPEFFGTKFDVILVDPPWEEYVHRAPGVTDHLEYWTLEEIQNLKIEAIADTPSFIFLWVGDGVGLEQGRQCLKKWGFRRCEDICWVKTNKYNAMPGLRHDSRTLFQHSKEHCLMGIKGTVRRSTDGHIIHANIDTDIIIAEEPPDGSTRKPDDMYRIVEHFALGRRRLELFGEDHNIRTGWLTVGRGLSSSNFNAENYVKNFADKDGKVWQGGGGRNPPPEAPHLVLTTPEIEGLRPKSPPAKSQQQQQSMSLMTTGNSNNRRASGNSPQNPSGPSLSGMNQDGLGSESVNQAPWGSTRMSQRGPEGGHNDKFYEGFGVTFGQVVGDHIEFDPQLNIM